MVIEWIEWRTSIRMLLNLSDFLWLVLIYWFSLGWGWILPTLQSRFHCGQPDRSYRTWNTQDRYEESDTLPGRVGPTRHRDVSSQIGLPSSDVHTGQHLRAPTILWGRIPLHCCFYPWRACLSIELHVEMQQRLFQSLLLPERKAPKVMNRSSIASRS